MKLKKIENTMNDKFGDILISCLKDKFGVHFNFCVISVGIRLFLLRCNRKAYMKHIARFNAGGHMLPGYKINEKIYKTREKCGWSKNFIKDYHIASIFRHLRSYTIKLDKVTFLHVEPIKDENRSVDRIRLSFYGRNVTKYVYFLQKTFLEVDENLSKLPAIYSPNIDSNNNMNLIADNREPRTFDSYYINKDLREKIMNYVNNAITISKKLEDKFGICYCPGIIFYGEPGTGKSSIIEAIAVELGATIIYIDLLHVKETIDEVKSTSELRRRKIILVYEDIDFLFTDRDASNDLVHKNNYNNLLQVLDGYLSVPNSINIATTNHIEKLDPALVRDGRFDLKIELKGLDKEEGKQMCDNYDTSYDILNDIKFPVSPAELQGKIFMQNKNDLRKGELDHE